MSLSRARRRRGPSAEEPGLPLDETDRAVPVTGDTEEPGTGAAGAVVEPEAEQATPGGEVTPGDEPEVPPSPGEPAALSEPEPTVLASESAAPDSLGAPQVAGIPAPVTEPGAPPAAGGPAAASAPAEAWPPPSAAAGPSVVGAAGARTDGRLAHVHLALGMFGLARAELETLAGRGFLDVPALADLAEVRWRTGDLVGAGEAADAHLQAGGEELVALCVAAEAATAAGRAADARNLAARVLARGRNRLDDLFAGQPRGAVWPPGAGSVATPAEPAAAGDRSAVDVIPPTAVPGMLGDLAGIKAGLDAGKLAGIATRLALVLRARPALAPAVLALADETLRATPAGGEAAALHLVRGDAYRLMGRESLAAEAFQQSSRALRAPHAEESP